MNNEQLAAYQIINSIQDNLIQVEVALTNRTMTAENARKHVKQLLIMTETLENQLDCKELTVGIKDIAKNIVEATRVQYAPKGMTR